MSTVGSLKLLLEYLGKFPLFSIKIFAMERFVAIFKQKIEKGTPSTIKEWEQLKGLCKEINIFYSQNPTTDGVEGTPSSKEGGLLFPACLCFY